MVGLLAACGTGARGGSAGEPVLVRVNNNLVAPTVISVYLVPEVGGRRLLGTVTPGSQATLRYSGSTIGVNFRLVARTTGGTEIPSTPFSVRQGETVHWDLQSRIATVSTP
jgi:hypothetical protein